MADKAPVKVFVEDGQTVDLPADLPDSYEIITEADDVRPIDWSNAFVPGGGTILALKELLDTEPSDLSDLDLEEGSTLIVAATRSEYRKLGDLNRYAESPYLANRGIGIEVRKAPSDE